MVIDTNAYARIAGPVWVVLAVLLYMFYRRRRRMPTVGSLPRDWEATTLKVLEEAEEYRSLEEYEAALAERDAAQSAPR